MRCRNLSATSSFCSEDEYLPLPSEHAAQIQRLKPNDARRVWQWLGPSIPSGWPESKPMFADRTELELNHENWNTDDGVQLVRQWLHDRGIPYAAHVFLVYEADQIIQMPWKLLVKYWDALAWSVGYSTIPRPTSTRQWACCFHHENWILYGTYSESRHNH